MIQFVILIFFIILNGFFAMSELAIISARKPFLKLKAQQGQKGAKTALHLANTPNRFLPSIQVGITTISILMGAFGGITISNNLEIALSKSTILAPYANTLALGVIVFFTSFVTLVIGELVPKRLALSNAEIISIYVSRPINVFATIATPFIKLLGLSTNAVLFILRIPASAAPSITEEEISHSIEMGRKAGLVEPDEQKMVKRIFEFGDRQAHSIMTPRTDVIWLDLAEPAAKNLQLILRYPFSRYPVIEKDPDNIVGIIKTIDILRKYKDEAFRVDSCLLIPMYVSEHMPVLQVLQLFRKNILHFAVVIDEYGGFSGIITPYDILQAIVGELPVSVETKVPMISKLFENVWEIDGSLPIQEFKVFFDIEEMPDEQRYGTISGFVIMLFGHIPKNGEKKDWNGYEFTISKMKNHRISKLQVHRADKSI